MEKDQEPKLEAEVEAENEPELGQEVEQVRPRRLRGVQWGGSWKPYLSVVRPGVTVSSMAVGTGTRARLPAPPPWELVFQPRG